MLDKLKIIENIKCICKVKGIAISDLEKTSGVSVGYLARLYGEIQGARNSGENEKERSLPPIDVMQKIAMKLNYSIDSIINYEFSGLNNEEFIISEFLNKLIEKTKTNSIIWKRESENEILCGAKYLGFDMHPLVRDDPIESVDYYDRPILLPNYKYYSLFLDCYCYLANHIYSTDIGNVRFIITHILKYENDLSSSAYELYSIENNEIRKIYFTSQSLLHTNVNSNLIKLLYSSAGDNALLNPDGSDIKILIKKYLEKL